jgi:RNA polymerase sigma-70 factor (ECF subfamily)
VELAIEIPNSLLLSDDAEQSVPDSGHLQDRILLAAFAQGDRDAFATIYKRHSRAVFQFALYMAGDAEKADELTQEVFVWLIHNPAAFEPTRGSLPAFLGGVARKFLRRQQRWESRWSPLEDAILALHSAGLSHTPPLAADAAIDAAQLRQAITLLPVRYREVVVLCDLQEKEYAEAARILDCSVGTVRSRLHRGRNLLARKLNPNLNTKGGRHAL